MKKTIVKSSKRTLAIVILVLSLTILLGILMIINNNYTRNLNMTDYERCLQGLHEERKKYPDGIGLQNPCIRR